MSAGSSNDNTRRVQAAAANVFYPTMLFLLWFEKAYVFLVIYIIFGIWFAMNEYKLYKALLLSNRGGRTYVYQIFILFSINGFLAYMAIVHRSDAVIIVCLLFLFYSAWFGYFKSKKIYISNKDAVDKVLSVNKK